MSLDAFINANKAPHEVIDIASWHPVVHVYEDDRKELHLLIPSDDGRPGTPLRYELTLKGA